jgi:soluble lytic murein transglycosylase-like protein
VTDVMARIAQIQARFAVAPPRASATAASNTAFSSVLASTKAATTVGADAADASTTDVSGALSRALASIGGGASSATTQTGVLEAIARRAYGTEATPSIPDSYERYRDEIAQVATEEGVPASLLGALVWSESGFDPTAVSPAGARGLAQLMPSTAEGLGVDIDDPADNLRGGARYLRSMLDRFGRADLALAAYNAGPNAVARAGGIPPYKETQTYVTRVLTRATALSGGTPT